MVFIRYLFRELTLPKNYLMALLIGLSINLLQGNGPFDSLVAYLVPVLVQAFSKAEMRFRNRERDLLARLPQHRADPVMVVDRKGQIVMASGKAWREHKPCHTVCTLQALFGEEPAEALLAEMNACPEGVASGTYLCPALGRPYTVHYCLEEGEWLVWLTAVLPESAGVPA
ncbi:MAG: hypothetical protein WBB45_01205 [Cyclobacteriaceae bacterium]